MYEIKTEDAYEVFSRDKQILDFSNYYDDSNKLVVVKMKNKTSDVAIEEFVGLKQKMYSFLVDNSSKHKKQSVNKNVVAKISHSEYNTTNKIQKLEPTKLTNFLYHALMIKYIS